MYALRAMDAGMCSATMLLANDNAPAECRGHRIALQVAKGLFYLHSNSVVHLDIKARLHSSCHSDMLIALIKVLLTHTLAQACCHISKPDKNHAGSCSNAIGMISLAFAITKSIREPADHYTDQYLAFS